MSSVANDDQQKRPETEKNLSLEENFFLVLTRPLWVSLRRSQPAGRSHSVRAKLLKRVTNFEL